MQRSMNSYAVLADRAQFVQVGVEASGDHAAVAQQCRGLVGDGAGEQRADFGRRVECRAQIV